MTVISRFEHAFFPILIAICENAMALFSRLHVALHRASKRLMKSGNFLEFIPLLLCTPVFNVSHFFFKKAYLLQQRRALLMRRKCAVMGIQEPCLEFEELGLEGLTVPQSYHRLRDILGRIERDRQTGNG